uniref:ALK and LTK ligand 1 n=1 Tax=Falco tinnunculus TaxID=100819 RepID=A0A8C4UJ26_FALTI
MLPSAPFLSRTILTGDQVPCFSAVIFFPSTPTLNIKNFIDHLFTFSSECSKHFHRLYHNTRDCSTPAYYKRCARLLTRLAMSPLCTQS